MRPKREGDTVREVNSATRSARDSSTLRTNVAATGPLAHLFHQSKAQPLIAVLSLSFILVSMQMTQVALFQREMMFKTTTVRLIVSAGVAGIVGIVVAVLGGGAWALIAQQLALFATSTLLLWIVSPWRPRMV